MKQKGNKAMNFLKSLFGEDTMIIGLSGFKGMKRTYNKSPIENSFNFNPLEYKNIFETNFRTNKLLL